MEKNIIPVYTKIDKNVKERATMYVTKSKLLKIEDTNTLNKLAEIALDEYMINHPL